VRHKLSLDIDFLDHNFLKTQEFLRFVCKRVILHFYSVPSAVIATAIPSVCPSVYPSHAGIPYPDEWR